MVKVVAIVSHTVVVVTALHACDVTEPLGFCLFSFHFGPGA